MTNVAEALKRSKSWMWSRRLRLTLLISVLVLTAPWPASGQADGPCCAILVAGLSSIANSLQSIAHSNPQQLETNLLSGNPSLIGQTSANYTALYGPVPPTTDASPQVRDLVDMTDAAAQDAMKRAIQIDALSDLELQAAGQINQSIQTAAPGSAPIIEAQADAWLVRANAYTQAATADLMRLRAIDLANSSADIKMGATNTTNLRQQLMNLLQHN